MTREQKFYWVVAALVYPAWLLTYEMVGWYAATLPARDITSALDRAIPLWPGFVWFYLLCYVFPVLPLFAMRDWHRFNRGLLAIAIANLSAYVTFIAFPVAMPRQALGSSLSERVLAFIYSIDFQPAVTAFPSLHVIFAWLVYFMCRGQRWGRVGEGAVFAGASMITLSTLFVKQHFIADVVAGVLWASVAWLVAGRLYPLLTNTFYDAPSALRQISRKLAPVVLLSVLVFVFAAKL